MRAIRWGLAPGLAALAVTVCGAIGAEPVETLSGVVTDERLRPLEGVEVQMCGVQRFHDGSWSLNRRVHCLMPRPSISDKEGRFTVPLSRTFFLVPPGGKNARANLWFDKDRFAPTFLSGVSAESGDLKVVMKAGIRVSGTVKRLVGGELKPVEGAAVYVRCLPGGLEHPERAVRDSIYFPDYVKAEGGDLPYEQRTFTGFFGEYTLRLSAQPKEKAWYVECLGEVVRIDPGGRPPPKGPDFVVRVKVREAGKERAGPDVAADGSR